MLYITKRKALRQGTFLFRRSGYFGALALLNSAVSAQEVFAPPSRAGESPAQSYALGADSGFSLFRVFDRNVFSSLFENPLQWGPFRVTPHASYRFTSGNGINRSPGDQQDTIQQQFSPGLSLLGRRVTLDYTPTFNYYSNPAFEDSLTHRASGSGWIGYGDWRFSLSQSFFAGSTALIETSAQTERQTFATGATATWLYSERTSFDFTISQNIQLSENFNNTRQWSTMEWINYSVSSRTTVGVGIGGGYADVDFGSDMTYQTVQGRIGWSPTQKIALSLTGGGEVRQFIDLPELENRFNPIMSASISYEPFEATSLYLRANRAIQTSIFAASVIETTGVTVGVEQRLLGTLALGISAGFRRSDYRSPTDIATIDRSDENIFFATSLGMKVFKKGSASIFFNNNRNTSSREEFSFDSRQYGFQIAYRF